MRCGEKLKIKIRMILNKHKPHTVDIEPGEFLNMSVIVALEWTHASPQRVWLNDVASLNMYSILVTLDTSHFEMSPLNDSAPWNMRYILLTRDTSHFEMSPLNDCALKNMYSILVTRDTTHCEMFPLNDSAPWNIARILLTRDTFHFEMSPLNDFAYQNIAHMSVTRDTSHSPMRPLCPPEQSPSDDTWRQFSTALLRSLLDAGKNPVAKEGK